MKHIIITSCLIILLHFYAISQKDEKLSERQTKELLSQINVDTTKFLSNFSQKTCNCIDSISLTDKTKNEVTYEISECINKQVTAYQLSLELNRALKSGNKNNEIILDTDKESPLYRRYYFEIERWLMDSCNSLKNAVASHNKQSEYSISRNPKARKQYTDGVEAMENEDYKKAVRHFKDAVEADPKFAFAWDNLGICQRKLGNYEEALQAYKKSLAIDPFGTMPLQNIPVVYEYQKKYEEALEAYKHILIIHPDDPEAFYGSGRIYAYFLVDMEKALENMCKAYNLYIQVSSPYRVDAEKQINYIYGEMKKGGKEKQFFDVLKQNNISTTN
jgi:tetratricopeptide (TPR) repeat protein